MLKVKLSFHKMVQYWNYDKGAGVKVDGVKCDENWNQDVRYLDLEFKVSGKNNIEKIVKEYLELHDLPSEYLTILDHGSLAFNAVEDGEARRLSIVEQTASHDKGIQTYICDYNISIEVMEVSIPKFEHMKLLFPSSDF